METQSREVNSGNISKNGRKCYLEQRSEIGPRGKGISWVNSQKGTFTGTEQAIVPNS